MPNYTADQLTAGTDASIAVFAGAPAGGGNSLGFSSLQILTSGILGGAGKLPTNSGGAGYDYWSGAGDAGAAGRGGNYYIQMGAQLTSGGDGSAIFLSPTGTSLVTIDSTGNITGLVGLKIYGSGTTTSYVEFASDRFKFVYGSAEIIRLGSGGLTCIGSAVFTVGTNLATLNGASTGIFVVWSGGSTSVGGSFAHTKGGSNLTVTGTTNNLALDASAFQRLTGSSTPILTGVAPPSGGAHVDGNIRYLYCLGATSIQLNHNDGSSTAANRLYMSTGANITLAQNQSVRLTYDSTDNGSGAAGWRCTSAS
jgi:hypothetical protein